MANAYKYLNFYDKNGNNLNFYYDDNEEAWIGSIYIPEVSIRLFESVNIFIVEEFITSNNTKIYGLPHISNPQNYTNLADVKWIAKWVNDVEKDIFIYQIVNTNDKPIIQIVDVLEIPVDIDINQSIDINTGQIISNFITSKAIQINIALNSDIEDIHERTLLIKEFKTDKLIAKIKFYGETIDMDERFEAELIRLGMQINDDEYFIFRQSDINEYLPDYKLLNQKRKEMLVEGRNIIPFIGSYKGLINAIKFYGYNNIKLREYWLNIDIESVNYGKYISTDVLDIFDSNVDLNNKNFDLPNKIYKKTNLFSLVYRLNKIENERNDDDLPITSEVFDFTFEEVLIKLFGLKNILQKKYLNGLSKIIDIIGEADYFTKVNNALWIDNQNIFKVSMGINPCFKILSSNEGYIQDLRKLEDIIFPAQPPMLLDPNLLANNNTITISQIANVLAAYFTDYSPNLDSIEELPDNINIPAGYPIVLENCSFNIQWDNFNVSWDNMLIPGTLIFEFEPQSFMPNDTFIIKDRISNEFIAYTVQVGDTKTTILNGLYNNLLNALNINDGRPWSYYNIQLVDLDNDNQPDAIRFTQLSNSNINVDLHSETIDGGIINNPIFIKRLVSGSTLNTWDTVGMGNFYEIEWHIWQEATDNQHGYEYNIRGDLGALNKLAIALPYTGKYNVELRLYDTLNQVSSKIVKDAITVYSKNVEFLGFYRFREKEYIWNSDLLENLSWNSYTSYWDLPIIPDAIIKDGMASLYLSLDRANYILNNTNPDQQLSYYYQNSINSIEHTLYNPGPYYWDNLDPAVWDDAYHLWWDATKISGDIPANFRIYAVDFNEKLIIKQKYPYIATGMHIFTTNDLVTAANDLNNSSDPVIKKYIYNPVYDNNNNIIYIQAVAKYFGENGDWTELNWTSGIDIRYTQLSEINNPTYNDIKFITNDYKILPKLVYITFLYDNCKIPGKNNPKWELINLDSDNTDHIYFNGQWFTYLFKRPGRYQLSLELTDSNGNKNKTTKNILIIK